MFFFTRNEIGKRNNAKNIEFCFFFSEKVFPLVSLRSEIIKSKRSEKFKAKKAKKAMNFLIDFENFSQFFLSRVWEPISKEF